MLFRILFIVAVCIANVLPQQYYSYNDTSSVITVEFDENMSVDGLLDTDNYSIVDENGDSSIIYNVGIVNEKGGIVIPDTSQIAIISERLAYRKTYTITVINVKNKTGIVIADKNWSIIFFDGYSETIALPVVGIKKDE